MGKKTNYSDKEERILTEITDFCQNSCASNMDCAEDECVLWRIEKIVTDGG